MIPKTTQLHIPKLLKCAQELSPSGLSAVSENNLFYLKIDDAYIHHLFPLLTTALLATEKITKPKYFGEKSAGAHITIAYPEEIKKINAEDLAKKHNFRIKTIISTEIAEKTYYVLLLESSSLLELRREYGLSDLLSFKNYSIGFHITVATRVA